MYMFKYVLKRLGLMLFTFAIIMTLCFILIKTLEPPVNLNANMAENERIKRLFMGYDKPVMEQFFIYIKNIVTKWDWGYSFKVDYMQSIGKIILDRLPATMIVNLYSFVLSIPVGIALGIYAALKKNKWQDNVISILVMIFISVPSYVYAFVMQYFLGYKLGLPITLATLTQAGGSWFSWTMFVSMILPILSLSFGSIASMTRNTRGELTEVLTSEYMLLARTKGLSKSEAILRHGLKNAMVPIFPGILTGLIGILGGSYIIETIFVIPGVGRLMIDSIRQLDYNVFMGVGMLYTLLGLLAGILYDISYRFLDPRIRIGARKV